MYKIYNETTNEFSGVQYPNFFYAMMVADMMSAGAAHYGVRMEN